MIDRVTGTLLLRQADGLVIDCQGLGFRVLCAPERLDDFPASGQTATIYTYLHVREDTMALYGFADPEDRNLFDLLLTVSGIGPKVALAIVGTLKPSQLALAVLSADTKTLTQVRGIGRKSAERLILELKDKLKSEDLAPVQDQETETFDPDASAHQEAISALLVLGYKRAEAAKAVAAVSQEADRPEDLIRLALRQLMP